MREYSVRVQSLHKENDGETRAAGGDVIQRLTDDEDYTVHDGGHTQLDIPKMQPEEPARH